MAIGRFSPRFARHWTHVIFHAGLSDDYEVAMTNFAGTRRPRVTIGILTITGTNQIAQPSELFINNTRIKNTSHTHIHTHARNTFVIHDGILRAQART